MNRTTGTGAGDPALTDPLTGLCNRRGFFRVAARRFTAARRRRQHCAAAFCDLDNLQEINAALSRDDGSAMLREVAELLQLACEPEDVIGRIGGKEFAVLAVGDRSPDDLRGRIAAAVERANARPERPYLISLSVGAMGTTAGRRATLDGLIAGANREMFEGRSRAVGGGSRFTPRVRTGRGSA